MIRRRCAGSAPRSPGSLVELLVSGPLTIVIMAMIGSFFISDGEDHGQLDADHEVERRAPTSPTRSPRCAGRDDAGRSRVSRSRIPRSWPAAARA